MLQRYSAIVVAALLIATALPAEANVLTSATAVDTCERFTLSVQGADLSAPSTVTYQMTLTPSAGAPLTVSGSIPVWPNANGTFSGKQTRTWKSFGLALSTAYALSGSAVLTSSGSTQAISFSPNTLKCSAQHFGFCPGTIKEFDHALAYSALGVGDASHGYQNAQLQGQQGSQVIGDAGIAGTHGQIQLQSWQQFGLPGLITGVALVQSDTQIQLDSDSFIQHGVRIDATGTPRAAADALELNASYGALAATTGPNTLAVNGPSNGPPTTVTISGDKPVNVLQLQQLQLHNANLVLKAPASSLFIVNVSGQVQLQSANIFVQGIPSGQVLLNVTSNQNVQMQNEADPDPDPDALVQATIFAPLSNNVQLESMKVTGNVVFGQQLQLHENSIVYGCAMPSDARQPNRARRVHAVHLATGR